MLSRRIALCACLLAGLLLGACQPGATGTDIRSFTQGMQHQAGLLPLDYAPDTGKLYLTIPLDQQEYIYYFSLPQGLGSNDVGLDRGQLMGLNTKLVRFDDAGDKVLLRQRNTHYRAETENQLEQRSVSEAFADAVLWGFPVVARESDRVLVDATGFATRDSHGVSRRLQQTKQGDYSLDASRSAIYPARTKAFPRNTEIEATVTFTGDNPGEFVRQVAADPHAISLRMHHSFVALPDSDFSPRAFHPQSGFWAFDFKDYGVAIEQDMTRRYIPRHRLQKKDPGAALSEAVEPIIYYLDPGTPEPVRTALLEGGRWWNQAFEAAGYKDAFQIRVLPADADPLDVRYNVIQWVHRATRGWSYGYGLTDPRTGEIIKGHVTLGSLRVRQDYLIAQGMTSPFNDDNADTAPLSAMALARIRQLSAHEIGHTLGIAHNFAASPKDRASVMDYPHPLLALENNQVSLTHAYAEGIGEWDKRVIQYGYGDFADDRARLAFIDQSRALGFDFISDPDSRAASDFHATASLWDNGADAAVALSDVMALRAHALANFGAQSLASGRAYSDLEEILVPVYYFHRYQAEAAGKWLGGYHYNYGVKGQAGELQFTPVAAADQSRALNQLLATLSPAFLQLPDQVIKHIPPKAYGHEKTRESTQGFTGALLDPVSMAEASVRHTYAILLAPERLARLEWQATHDQHPLTTGALLNQIWLTLNQPATNTEASTLQWRNQLALFTHLSHMMTDDVLAPEVFAALKGFAQHTLDNTQWRKEPRHQYLKRWAEKAASQMPTNDKLKKAAMPPGSPI
ncbi:zinc-dependent metalloprotease [Simiduia agarivorans]|uniref:Extracellular metal-dependent peptidase n=1 Tax=Simiduia agarivorans (strain DSM 21679 / JCM 13881 / BCRC 17597 / SA1) TaxID=1117647 RepID=K4KLS6_SIMAS|nr:zinc-dependent metalloprotease [Simiduia agarivorans]AFV00130.1 hypothetical protein M5M_14975 [Simiduia agarivorans SA1 = DSM 21679]